MAATECAAIHVEVAPCRAPTTQHRTGRAHGALLQHSPVRVVRTGRTRHAPVGAAHGRDRMRCDPRRGRAMPRAYNTTPYGSRAWRAPTTQSCTGRAHGAHATCPCRCGPWPRPNALRSTSRSRHAARLQHNAVRVARMARSYNTVLYG